MRFEVTYEQVAVIFRTRAKRGILRYPLLRVLKTLMGAETAQVKLAYISIREFLLRLPRVVSIHTHERVEQLPSILHCMLLTILVF